MAKKRKAKQIKPKRTAKKSKRKKWSAPEVDVFDEALKRAGKATPPDTFRCQ